ncbi:conserved hypothetical protein [Methanococcus vannielii SB]|uniref:Uncharacterized protein n=1 Tax=Methanococcus vannielii (strain ATCC 35089 / DSM 1224 / JCM 13029 / OCM 148 / SB) TaxID=406327 RepID=A6UP36_METVS|nr:hypothetical protein [Methanococcus vannielii]ABR54258.1 conserved hypothetical protein [Methanococcus vannielii SB]
MDVYDILFLKCSEYEVLLNEKQIPLWMIKKENALNVNFDLPWNNLQDLAIYLYELKREQQKSKDLLKCNLEEILVGISYLPSKKSGSLLANESIGIDACLSYLSEFITARINCIYRYHYPMTVPVNKSLFDEVILKFPQKKDVKAKNKHDFEYIVSKLKNYDFKLQFKRN